MNKAFLESHKYYPDNMFLEKDQSSFWHARYQDNGHSRNSLVIKKVAFNQDARNTPVKKVDNGKRGSHAFKLEDRELRNPEYRLEALISQVLASEHVVSVIDVLFDQINGYMYLVFENQYTKGYQTLESYAANNNLTFDQIISIFEQILSVVKKADQKKILLQDIKPDNIWIKILPNGAVHAKFGDFGIARPQNDIIDDIKNLDQKTISGTPPFTAPEKIFEEEEPIDIRSDFYSIGVSVFYLLFKRHYYDLSAEFPPTHFEVFDLVAQFYYRDLFKTNNQHQPHFIHDHEYTAIAEQGIDTLALLRFFIKTLGKVGYRYKTTEELLEGLRQCKLQENPADKFEVTDEEIETWLDKLDPALFE